MVLRSVFRIDPLLSFAVVAKSRALQDRGPADCLQRASSGPARSATRRNGATGNPAPCEELFFPQPILRDEQDLAARPPSCSRVAHSIVLAGMFSNSNVSTSIARANCSDCRLVIVGRHRRAIGQLRRRTVLSPAKRCERDIPSGAPRWQTCGPTGRHPSPQSSPRAATFSRSVMATFARERLSSGVVETFSTARANLGVMQSDDTGGKESGVFRSRDADGESSDRDAGRHLRNRKQRVESLQCARLDRHSEHRQPGLRGNHAGQMGRAARARDDHLHPTLGGFARELRHQVRRPVRGDDPMLVRHTELYRATPRNAASFPNPRRSPSPH